MIAQCRWLCTLVLTASFAVLPAGAAEIPKKVMDTLKAKFPNPVIRKWTREKEAGVVLYDIEFQQAGRNFEADIKADGAIHNWEQEIAVQELPEVVRKTVETRHPGAVLKQVMLIRDGKDATEGYEIVLTTRAKAKVEMTVAPDGKIVEEAKL